MEVNRARKNTDLQKAQKNLQIVKTSMFIGGAMMIGFVYLVGWIIGL